jgi:hypothetical protein
MVYAYSATLTPEIPMFDVGYFPVKTGTGDHDGGTFPPRIYTTHFNSMEKI